MNTLGVALYRVNELTEARRTLNQAVLVNGGDAFDYYALAMVHAQLKQSEKAKEYIELAEAWCREHESSGSGLDVLQEEAHEALSANIEL